MELLTEAVQHQTLFTANITTIKSTMTILLGKLEASQESNRGLGQQVSRLGQQVSSLEMQVTTLLKDLDDRKRKALLGQLVYVVAAYVYGPHYPYHVSVRDIAADTKTEAEQQRCERLCSYLLKQDKSTRDVIGTTGAVRSLRFETAHGNAQQHTSTTVDQLQTWARQLLQVREEALWAAF